MSSAFSNIGLIGRSRHDSTLDSLQRLLKLVQGRALAVTVEPGLAQLLDSGDDVREASREAITEASDLVIVVGGDGSMLGAAPALAQFNTPVLGVNRGRLGFLTDISPDEIEARVSAVLDGAYEAEHRFLLDVTVRREGQPVGTGDALNDVVVNSGTSAQMIEFELFISDTFVYRQRADGLIVSTPTGSTAYALSGGGPIMHPALDALVLVPMFPHTLNSRPIVVDGSSEIRIDIVRRNRIFPPVTCDGRVNITAHPGDSVHIYKKPQPLILIHPQQHCFYASCRDKLRWSSALVE